MARAERYQLPLLVELGGRPAETRRAFLDNLVQPGEETSRFVRAVREEVVLRSPEDAARHLMNHVYTPFEQLTQEEFWTLLVNTKNRVTHEVLVYRGTLNTIHVRIGELFREAVRVNAAGMLLSHSHPSGIADPSPEDVRLTEEIVKVGKLLDTPVIDHIIIGRDDWLSMKAHKLGFPDEC